jgi:uncharacterized protein YabN with tetrapyrrole methylase and pyrophosphatase domain
MPEIVVAGAGMLSSLHMTVDTIREVSLADHVFHMLSGPPAIAMLQRLNPRTHSLVGFYREGDLDLDVYNRIVSFLIAQAMAHQRIVFVVMGHPSIYVAPTHLLTEHAPRYGVTVRICPAVSAIDTILAVMPFDIANTGLQILDANRIVAYALEPARNVPLLVFQVGCFGSGYITRLTANSPDRLRPLAEYLGRIYPPEHVVELIESEMEWPHRAVRLRMPLMELASNGHLVTYNTTLYVPPCQPVKVENVDFQQGLLDSAAVGKLVSQRSSDD